jgi:hypothetical protein
MQPELAIGSVGAPAPQHASRIIANMLKHLAGRHARVFDIIKEISGDPHVRDGSPKAQRRLERKIQAVGNVMTSLTTGKRGVYCLRVYMWIGWNPVTNTIITVDDDLPPRPWLCHFCYEICGQGKCLVRYMGCSILFITHHSLQRCAERWRVITVDDLEKVVNSLSVTMMKQIEKMQDACPDDINWHITPPNGIRVPINNGKATIVLKGHETLKALVLVTVLA